MFADLCHFICKYRSCQQKQNPFHFNLPNGSGNRNKLIFIRIIGWLHGNLLVPILFILHWQGGLLNEGMEGGCAGRKWFSEKFAVES